VPFHPSSSTSSGYGRISGRTRRLAQWFSVKGGDSATGSGEDEGGNNQGEGSCTQNGKWITSLAAIVAPQTCDCGQGRVGAQTPARPAHLGALPEQIYA
jgi:hypothetical protein